MTGPSPFHLTARNALVTGCPRRKNQIGVADYARRPPTGVEDCVGGQHR
jgi:hypothetical protein